MKFFERIKDHIQGKAAKGQKRADGWLEFRDAYVRDNPKCVVCGAKKKLQVHHIVPFHVAPDLELDPTNLLTLCVNKKYGINCHLLVGHCGNYRRVNPNVELDAMTWKYKLS